MKSKKTVYSFPYILWFVVLVFACSGLMGCATSSDYNSSMDYNPGWENKSDQITSFDQLPRHKNRISLGEN